MKPVWILRHTPDESPGLLEPVLQSVGLRYEIVEMWRPPLPEFTEGNLAGLVVLGGAMNADQTDHFPFLSTETVWLRRAAESGLPVLGICLGAQLLARSLGARVTAHSCKEIGWYTLTKTASAAGDPLFGDGEPIPAVFQWHGDTFDLPEEARLLARGAVCAHQAFRVGERAYGLQFHPEVDAEIIERWLDEPAGREELAALDYIDAQAIPGAFPTALPAMRRWSVRLLRRFAELCRDEDRPRQV